MSTHHYLLCRDCKEQHFLGFYGWKLRELSADILRFHETHDTHSTSLDYDEVDDKGDLYFVNPFDGTKELIAEGYRSYNKQLETHHAMLAVVFTPALAVPVTRSSLTSYFVTLKKYLVQTAL